MIHCCEVNMEDKVKKINKTESYKRVIFRFLPSLSVNTHISMTENLCWD